MKFFKFALACVLLLLLACPSLASDEDMLKQKIAQNFEKLITKSKIQESTTDTPTRSPASPKLYRLVVNAVVITIGKYFIFYHYLKDEATKQYGNEIASSISILTEEVIYDFIEDIGSMVSGFDILWIILAVITAWRIPKGLGIKLVR